MVDQSTLRDRITELIGQEHALREQLGAGEITESEEHQRLRALEVELDQCWDLLRQRRARSEFGQDTGETGTRSESTVEGYLQ